MVIQSGMRYAFAPIVCLTFSLCTGVAHACDRPVCLVDPDPIRFGRIITFDDQPGNFGPGLRIDGLLILPGASFGERMAGQVLTADGDFDRVTGPASPPLALVPGAAGQGLSVLRITGATLLSGTGPRGFPTPLANGEGAIAILFDADQAAFRLDLRGGEGGVAHLLFLARDGSLIDEIDLSALAEVPYGFARNAPVGNIAGVVISNHDPEGIALDGVAFDSGAQTSMTETALRRSGSG